MVIYHYPKEIVPSGNVASVLRPARMRDAFSAIGEEVFDLTGSGMERVRKARELHRKLKAERGQAIVYSESVNVPPALTWLRRGPLRMGFDYHLLQDLHDRGIPIGLFYRDIHWLFERTKAAGIRSYIKNLCIPFFGRQELQAYEKSVDVLFLPNVRMATHLPCSFLQSEIRSLPPGGEARPLVTRDKAAGAPIDLLFVGNIAPPVYDLRRFFSAVDENELLRLQVITRERALRDHGDLYKFDRFHRIAVAHAQGSELDAYYHKADIALCVWEDSDYHEFVMPVKVFEAISFGLPIIVSAGSDVLAEFIQRNRAGWVVSGVDEFSQLLCRLAAHPEEIEGRRRNVEVLRVRHTWEARAREVVETLRNIRKS